MRVFVFCGDRFLIGDSIRGEALTMHMFDTFDLQGERRIDFVEVGLGLAHVCRGSQLTKAQLSYALLGVTASGQTEAATLRGIFECVTHRLEGSFWLCGFRLWAEYHGRSRRCADVLSGVAPCGCLLLRRRYTRSVALITGTKPGDADRVAERLVEDHLVLDVADACASFNSFYRFVCDVVAGGVSPGAEFVA